MVSQILFIKSRIPMARKINWTVSNSRCSGSGGRDRSPIEERGPGLHVGNGLQVTNQCHRVARVLPRSSRTSGFLWKRIGKNDVFCFPCILRSLLNKSYSLCIISRRAGWPFYFSEGGWWTWLCLWSSWLLGNHEVKVTRTLAPKIIGIVGGVPPSQEIRPY